MLRIALLALCLLSGPLGGSTIEVVNLYQPLSLHGTDGAVEFEGEPEALQAAVLARPFAVSGAIPEDLVKAISAPYRIASNNPAYDVKDANLLNLAKITLTTEMRGERLLVRFNVSKLAIPEEVDLSARQILKLAITSVRRTMKSYFRGDAAVPLEVSIGIVGTNESNASLEDLAVRFKAAE